LSSPKDETCLVVDNKLHISPIFLLSQFIVLDHISMISKSKYQDNILEKFSKDVYTIMSNSRKYRGKIERRKEKIKRIYE
jgi:hypothetical protein